MTPRDVHLAVLKATMHGAEITSVGIEGKGLRFRRKVKKMVSPIPVKEIKDPPFRGGVGEGIRLFHVWLFHEKAIPLNPPVTRGVTYCSNKHWYGAMFKSDQMKKMEIHDAYKAKSPLDSLLDRNDRR